MSFAVRFSTCVDTVYLCIGTLCIEVLAIQWRVLIARGSPQSERLHWGNDPVKFTEEIVCT